MNAKVTTTSVTRSANELLGKKESKLYYLIIENGKGDKMTINIGEKTHNQVKLLTEGVTKIQIAEPEKPNK